jgi:hypothetical protein
MRKTTARKSQPSAIYQPRDKFMVLLDVFQV